MELHEQCVELAKPTENSWEPMMVGSNYAEALCGVGKLDQATQVIADNLRQAREAQSRHWEGIALRVHGQILTECKKWD